MLVVENEMRDDRSVVNLLKTDYTFVNQRLAEHYGIQDIYGNEFRRIAVSDSKRQGLLGHASLMAVTSYPNRTAPTIRGSGVLEQLLARRRRRRPPMFPALKEEAGGKVLTMRARMEEHRTSPQCAFATGSWTRSALRWRTSTVSASARRLVDSNDGAIDSSGVLPDGTRSTGRWVLRDILVGKKRERVRGELHRTAPDLCSGRGVEEYDRPIIRKIAREAAPDDHRWSSIIFSIVKSKPFQMSQARGAMKLW